MKWSSSARVEKFTIEKQTRACPYFVGRDFEWNCVFLVIKTTALLFTCNGWSIPQQSWIKGALQLLSNRS